MTTTAASGNTPQYGHRLVPIIIDETANRDPDKLFAVICTSSGANWESRNVSYKDMSRAISRAAWWLEEKLGGRGKDFPTIGYMATSDFRYVILSVAANKAGYKILFPSPRNSVEYHVHILEESKCNIMFHDESTTIKGIQEAKKDLKDMVMPSVDFFLDAKEVEHYPYHETADSMHEPTIVLHSSGSTGPPKVITWTQGSLPKFDAQHDLIEGNCRIVPNTFNPASKILNTFPLFHSAAQIFAVSHTCYYDQPNVYPPPGQVKAGTVIDVLNHIDIKLLATPPSVLEELAASEKALQKLRRRHVFYGGGPLAESAGDVLKNYAEVHCMIGTTESGEFPLLTHDVEDWNYFHYPEHLKGIEFRKRDDDLYEMVFVRDPETDRYHTTWITFPDLEEYSTKDLYAKHPDKAGLWVHRGRSDDTIALSNGEKFVPIPYEGQLKQNKLIRDALLIGQGQFEVSVLIELNDEYQDVDREDALKQIIPTIKSINTHMPRFARMSQDRVIFVAKEKPMVRAGKGTVIRKATLKLYDQEIKDLYAAEAKLEANQLPLLKNTTEEQTAKSLIDIFSHISELDENIDHNTNFYNLGFDSLNTMKAARTIKAIISTEGFDAKSVTTTLIYSNPTIKDLTKALRSINDQPQDQESIDKARIQAMEDMLTKYSESIQKSKINKVEPVTGKLVVVLTGSTGSLGSYLLDDLVKSDKVARVYALNRGQDGKQRQAKAFSNRNLDTAFKKVTFLASDISQKDLGISKEDFSAISDSAHIILHNGWPVDFNLSLNSFEKDVAGIRNFIDLSLAAKHHPYIIFTSSVGTLGDYPKFHPKQSIPAEKIFNDSRIPSPMGYTMSKQIGERLLNIASERTGLRTSIARLGQIGGPVDRLGGVWNKQEWLPSIVVSSAYLKALPSDLNSDIDWLPVDLLADTLVDICAHDVGPKANLPVDKAIVYNLINPSAVSWSDLTPTILENLPAGSKPVPMKEWVELLRKSSEVEQVDTTHNPAVKLLDFFYNLAQAGGEVSSKMQVENGKKVSETLRTVKPVNGEWMTSWMKGWGVVRE